MALPKFQKWSYRVFGRSARRSAENNPRLRLALERAHIILRPDVYLASGYMAMFLSAMVTFLPILFLVGMSAMGMPAPAMTQLLPLLPLPALLPVTLYVTMVLIPEMKAMERARDIEKNLPYALNYIATMAGAGTTPDKVFGALAKNQMYGEVTNEAAWICRDLDLLGCDIMTALAKASDRTPSQKFQDFLQGAITVLGSGGDLQEYFLGKSNQFLADNRQEQTRALEGLGVMAEAFVTVVVAAPLFLIVMLSVMTSFGADPAQVLLLGYLLVLVMLPLSQAGFAATIQFMTPGS